MRLNRTVAIIAKSIDSFPTSWFDAAAPKTMTAAASDSQVELPPTEEPQLRDLFSFTANDLTFAVFADQVEATSERTRVARLPNSPAAVLGVVSVRGRMVTTLDPLALGNGTSSDWPSELPFVIALRGDEQLGLAAESLSETITIAATDIELPDEAEQNQAVLGIARHGGKEIIVLNPGNLFSVAVRRRERRRRRF